MKRQTDVFKESVASEIEELRRLKYSIERKLDALIAYMEAFEAGDGEEVEDEADEPARGRRRRAGKVCSVCGKKGHDRRTCGESSVVIYPITTETINNMAKPTARRVPLTPERLGKVRDLLKDEVSLENIEAETGVNVETIERIRDSMGA